MTDEELEDEFPVEIMELPERRVAFVRVIGAYEEGRVTGAFERMINWATAKNLFEDETIFGMSLDDPTVTPKDKYRYEVCLTVPESVAIESDSEISEMIMPACRYAVTRVSGDIKIVATATEYLFNKWLINSSFEPEHLPGLEIFLDKEKLANWEHFDLELCVPIKPLKAY
jgi:AraC family transcriptional regulator